MPNWGSFTATTASTDSSYNYDDYVIQVDKNFEKEGWKKFELQVEKHRDKKNKDAKKEYMFNPDDLDI